MYHQYWPSPGNDPWYWNNTPENDARRVYYGVNYLPWAWCDGDSLGYNLTPTIVTNAINGRAAITSPFSIDVQGDLSTASVTVKVIATGTPPGENYALRIAAVEKEYVSPIAFPNGEKTMRTAMLDMVPDAAGTPVSLLQGDSMTVNYAINTSLYFHPTLDLTLVAWVQDDNTREVMQASMFHAGMDIGAGTSSALIQSSANAELSGFVVNHFDGSNDVDVSIAGTIPGGWNVTANSDQGAITVNGSAITANVAPADTFFFEMIVEPNGVAGSLELTATAQATGSPDLFESASFNVLTKDIDILIVDDDGGNDYENYALDAINAAGASMTVGALPVQSGDLLPNDLDGIQMVMWNCGISDPTLTEADADVLKTYLDSGGLLYLNGVDIAYSLADPGSPNYTTNTLDFFNNYLHADYVLQNYQERTVDGVPGDPITGDLSNLKCFAGSGANNLGVSTNKWPDEIAAFGSDSYPIFSFRNQPTRYAGIRTLHGATGKVVFTTFGFEAIGRESDRFDLMYQIMDWLIGLTAIDPVIDAVPEKFWLHQNYPNPFNPNTTIRYEIPAANGISKTSLVVYNELGQIVRTLVNETQGSGVYRINWNGRNDAGDLVSSGLYFYKLKHGPFQSTQKMLLIR